jgi:nucleolar protein 56
MKAFIVQFPFGVAAFDGKNQLVEKALFPKKPQAAAKSLLRTEQGKLSDQITSLVTLLKTVGYEVFVFSTAKMAEEAQRRLEVTVEVIKPSEAAVLNSLMSEIAVEAGFVAEQQELDVWNRNVSMELSKLRIKGATGKRDLIVSQSIQTLDSLDQTVNLFMGRLREWYGVYFPELDRLVEKHETYSRLVMNLGGRDNFTRDALETENIPTERAALIVKAAEGSMGADVNERDLEQVQQLAKDVLAFYELRKSMEDYVDSTMEEMAPNIRAVAGALLGARMISIAGSLQNLAMRPASTIQVLGAEKALFRSLKTGARPPKHGLIFQHTLLHDAKRWQRGKIARVIAGKLAIAARADAFGEGHYIGDVLKAEINKRIEEIHEKYKEAPPPKEAKPRASREGGFERRQGGERRFEGGGGERRFNRPPRRDGGFDRRQGGGRRFEGRRDREEQRSESSSEPRFTYREPHREGKPQFQQKPRNEEQPRESQGQQAPPQTPRQEAPQRDNQQRAFTPKPQREGPPKGGKRRRKQWRDNRGRSS